MRNDTGYQDGDMEQDSSALPSTDDRELDPCEKALDDKYGSSAVAAKSIPDVCERKTAWGEKKKFLRNGDVIFCRAKTNIFHYVVGLGQVRNYSDQRNDHFRFWSHTAIVVWKCGEIVKNEEGEAVYLKDFVVAQAESFGVGFVKLESFLEHYQYQCWAFRPGGFYPRHPIPNNGSPRDVNQTKQAVIDFAKRPGEKPVKPAKIVEDQAKKFEYPIIALISILLAHIFDNLRIRFHLVGQFTCAGLIGELLERGDYRFIKGETHAFPAEVAIKIQGERCDPKKWVCAGYHAGVVQLFQQLRENLVGVTCGVGFLLLIAGLVFGFLFYAGALIGNSVAPWIAKTLPFAIKAIIGVWVAVLTLILVVLVSLRKYPIKGLWTMSIVSALITMALNPKLDVTLLETSFSNIGACFVSIYSFAALVLGIAAMLFSLYGFVILCAYLLYPFLYMGWRKTVTLVT